MVCFEIHCVIKKRDQYETEFPDRTETRKVKLSYAKKTGFLGEKIASFCVTSCLAAGIDFKKKKKNEGASSQCLLMDR